MQGLQAGAQMAEMDQRRAALAAQAQAAQQKAEAERMALQQKAAEQAELQQLQQVPFEQMTQPQRLRLMQLSNSEVSRSYIARALDQMSSEQKSNQATSYGALVTALVRNPEIGVRNLRVRAEAETDPARKKALEDAARIAETNPLEAARAIHTTMEFTGDERFVKAGTAALNFLKNTGTPLYPEAPKPLMTVGGAVFDPNTRQFMEPPRKSQLLTPEEEAQKARLARAGRALPQPRELTPTITQIQDPTDPARMITIDARRYQGGGMGSPGVIGTSGKTPKAEEERIKRERGQSDAADILDTLQAAYDQLDALRAIPSEQRGALSNLLAGIAATGVGQTAGRMVGTKEQTQRDIIASARNQLFAAVKNATGLSAQNLNSNVEFTTWLNSLTDPSRSIEANRAILENMQKFIASGGTRGGRTATGTVAPAPAAPTAPATPYSNMSNDEILRRLTAPSGGR